MVDKIPLKTAILSANTGLDAIKRAPIVDYDTGRKCLRIQDVSQEKIFHDWGFTDVTDGNYEKFRLKEEDILIARTGASIGVSRYIPFDLESVYNNGLIRIRVDKKTFDPKYIYYLLQSQDFKDHIYAIAFATAAQPNMKIRDFLRFEIPYLPLQQQSYAASFLSNLDDKIELNRQINTTLESMAQALFKSWFVDFDPVIDNALAAGNEIPDALQKRAAARAARAARRSSAQANNAGSANSAAQAAQSDNEASPDTPLPAEIQQLFPDAFVFTEEMGWVPEGWELKKLGDFAEKISKGTTPSKAVLEQATGNNSIPFIKVKDLDDFGDIKLDSLEIIPDSVHAGALKRSVLQVNDVLFSIAGTIGRVAIVPSHLHNSNTNQAVAFVRPKKQSMGTYITMLLRSEQIQGLVNSRIVQAVQANFSLTELAGIPVLDAGTPIFDQWHEQSKAWFSAITLNRDSSVCLSNVRDSLLPKLLSGQLTIPDAEQQLAEVL